MSHETTGRGRRFFFTLVLIATAVLLPVVATQAAVQAKVAADPDAARAGELLEVEISVTNDGPSNLINLTLLLDIPANLASLAEGRFDADCPGTACEVGEQATFDLTRLDAGSAVTFKVPARVNAAALDGVVIPFTVHVLENAVEIATGSDSVTVDTTRELELALTADIDPVARFETVTYTLTWGLVDTSPGLPNVTLRFPIPAGTTFVDASSGALPGGGQVEWALGALDPGDRGREQVSVSIDGSNNDGSALVATATLDAGGGDAVDSRVATRITDDDSLELIMIVSPEPARPNETIDLEMVIGNDGAFDRTAVELLLEFPEHLATVANFWTDAFCPGTACEAAEREVFDLGTRVAGKGITRSVPVRADALTADGTVIPWAAEVRDNTAATGRAGAAIGVSAARELELELAQARDAVAPDDLLEYDVTWGLIDSSVGVTDATLSLKLPPGTTFETATGGGSENGGEIVWSLGDLDPGDHGEQVVRTRVDPATAEGTALLTEARIDAFDTAPLFVRQLSRVEPRSPIEIDLIASPDAARPGEVIDLEITLTNTSDFDRTGVEMLLETPDYLLTLTDANFDGTCAGTACESRERALFSVGTLEAGEGRMFAIPARVNSTTLDGTTLDWEVEVRSDDEVIEAATSFAVDSTRRLELVLFESDEPVVTAGTMSYTLVYGTTLDGGGVSGAMLELTLPDEVTLAAASDNGVVNGGVVTWALNDLDPGDGGSRTAAVQIAGGLSDGALLRARARMFLPSGEEVRAAETTRIDGIQPFDVSFDIAQTHVEPGQPFDALLSVRNDSGFERTDVKLSVEFPSGLDSFFHSVTPGTCPGTACEARENLVYNIPTLLDGETISYPLQITVDNPTLPGRVIHFDAYATDVTDYFSHDGDALMAGTVFDPAGPKPAIGSGSVPDGSNGVPLEISLLTADTMLLTWGESCVPGDGDYEIYAGTIGDYTSHTPITCTTGSAEAAVMTTPPDSVYYLIVPLGEAREGSYGRRSDGSERPQGLGACMPQQVDDTCQP